ncbi:hypothetical protein B0H14DRAFT_2627474 [Mycena olivaceomarginata]|nr:hypothetical protein B0H14DRAFT_2627474 [Mycena olivaceomarginata]
MTPTTGPTPHPDHGSTPAPMPTRATQPFYSDPETLFNAVDEALQVDGKCKLPYLGGVPVDATRKPGAVSHNGSLIYGWLFTRSLACPGKYKCPPFERDDAWYSVVIHGVPMPPDGGLETYTVGNMAAYLNYAGAFVGAVKAFSILCRPEDLKSR